jgi:hypothetical protein
MNIYLSPLANAAYNGKSCEENPQLLPDIVKFVLKREQSAGLEA